MPWFDVLAASGLLAGLIGTVLSVKRGRPSGNVFAMTISMICVIVMYSTVMSCSGDIRPDDRITVAAALGICLQITLCNLLIFSGTGKRRNKR